MNHVLLLTDGLISRRLRSCLNGSLCSKVWVLQLRLMMKSIAPVMYFVSPRYTRYFERLKETLPLFLIEFLPLSWATHRQGCIPEATTTAHALGLLLDPSPAILGTVVCVCV